MKRHTAERDGISNLPAPILHNILSFLSEKEAVQTCLLSKSWRHLVSTRPNFSLQGFDFREDQKKFMKVLQKSLQVYYSQKLCIEEFHVSIPMVDPESVLLLKKWIPILIHDIGVKKLRISFDSGTPENFESESLQESYLQSGSLRHINSVGKHLKTLFLNNVYIEEETFAKILSSCPLIEDLTLYFCVGFRTIKMHNHHNLKRFTLKNNSGIEIYLPSTVRYIYIKRCPNWFHHRYYFPSVTRLRLDFVPLSNEWFNSLSRNFPILEELLLWNCDGFDEFQLSSRSIKYVHITMAESTTTKATIDAPNIKKFHYDANISQSISFSTTSSSDWKSQIRLSLNKKVSLCFLKLSLTRLTLTEVLLSNEWFNSFSHNFPCLEDLKLSKCKGFHEFQLSSRSIKILDVTMHKSTIKATIDAPSLNFFRYKANISQSISFSTNSSEWKSQIEMSLDIDSSLWFLKLSVLVAEFSQSQISLVLYHSRRGNQHIEHLSVCCSGSYTPIVMKSLELNLNGLYYDSFFSDLMNGLFLIIRPSEIKQNWFVDAQKENQRKQNEIVEFLCRTLQMGRLEDEGMSFWQHDIEGVSLEVQNVCFEDWHPVRGTINLSEYVAALLPPLEYTSFYKLCFRLKWRE